MVKTFPNSKQLIRVLMLGAGLDVCGGITSVEKIILENAPSGLQIQHVATFAKGSAMRNIRVFLQALQTLIRILVLNQVDVIHIHFSDRGSTLRKLILSAISWGFRKPFILHCHGAAYQEFYVKLPFLAQKIITAVFSRCDKFIALSESWRDFYLKSFQLTPEQVVVLPNTVELPPEFPDRSDRQSTMFVFLGRIGKHGGALDAIHSVMTFPKQDKGAFDLIRAFAALLEDSRVHAKLVLAGNGDVELAQQLIEELDIAAQATVYSWLNSTQRDQLLAEADVFVLPSYHEGLPMSMLEAMAWGLPVIVTPVGGIPEVITSEKNGLLVQPGNQVELTETMHRLITDKGLKTRLGDAARCTIEQFGVNSYIRTLSEIYSSVLR